MEARPETDERPERREIWKRNFKAFAEQLVKRIDSNNDPNNDHSSDSVDLQPLPPPAPNNQHQATENSGSHTHPQAVNASVEAPEQQGQPSNNTTSPQGADGVQNGAIPPGLGAHVAHQPEESRPPTPPFQGRLRIRTSEKARGKGVFTTMDLSEGEVILHENPWITCDNHNTARHVNCPAVPYWRTIPEQTKYEICRSFPQLQDIPSTNLTESQEHAFQEFVARYAFQHNDWQRTKHRLALVYLSPSLLNHACEQHANCRVAISARAPHTITVTLKRDISVDEELLMTYINHAPYKCMGCCGKHRQKARRALFGALDNAQKRWDRFRGATTAHNQHRGSVPTSQQRNGRESGPL